ncbi:FusB/FusC family EF-G-binding protein [Brevibacillus humidisoli]|uniref:FusB/FusC family EF-G-binding protein n=1 Tax=Brevibacillus humidisoli TaxID=2895522 RepID=UPI001E3CC397|nr:FusB/FusC family EF-G-binding protein [Brevibacillus humidisoli]UFJ39845.1 FusB/FusC family EF-G-binding protein [Brevibacillus humidisoli]
MVKPFIRNHQFNLIKKQIGLLQHACNTISDPKVVESVRYSVQTQIMESLPDAMELHDRIVEEIETLRTAGDFHQYVRSLEPYLEEFAPVTQKQLKKLFPKNKKLKVPNLTDIDYRSLTYLGWTDIATNKMFLVYHLDGQLVGVEGTYTPLNKKNACFLCNRPEEVALFSAITKSKPVNASPDYYKAIGNYMCINSDVCNKNITDVTRLEAFVRGVVGDKR